MRRRQLVLVSGTDGDWEGLYVDGLLKCQGHSVRLEEMAEALGLSLQHVEVDQEWLERNGLPESVWKLVRPMPEVEP